MREKKVKIRREGRSHSEEMVSFTIFSLFLTMMMGEEEMGGTEDAIEL
ncbi:hypothetical protein [Geobacillus sp. 47C-IIb]|jgi:hypothetical protein|nr:hypothetical protein [Geobacillus sp. 47C-IIb]QNU30160.1 hypothetical protein IC804_11585 [Geobacillus sp. 47C-IIb]